MEHNFRKESLTNICEVELVHRSRVKASEWPTTCTSSDALDVLRAVWEEGKMDLVEQFKVIFLNGASQAIGIYPVSSCGITGTVADARLFFSAALKANTVSLVLCYNHPSGSLSPPRRMRKLHRK